FCSVDLFCGVFFFICVCLCGGAPRAWACSPSARGVVNAAGPRGELARRGNGTGCRQEQPAKGTAEEQPTERSGSKTIPYGNYAD
ncbi:hypothetical protein, partial [Streptomyces celluloflavus]